MGRRAVITLAVGQFGVQQMNSLWRLYCKEHKIDFDGKAKEYSDFYYNGFLSYFRETDQGNNCFEIYL